MKKRIILSFAFFIIGLFIYFLFKVEIIEKNNIVFLIIRNYVPDICWVLSFYFLSISIMSNITKNDLLFNSLYVLIISLLYEFLQYFKIINGTFDLLDIIIYVLSIGLASLIEIKIRRKNEKNV